MVEKIKVRVDEQTAEVLKSLNEALEAVAKSALSEVDAKLGSSTAHLANKDDVRDVSDHLNKLAHLVEVLQSHSAKITELGEGAIAGQQDLSQLTAGLNDKLELLEELLRGLKEDLSASRIDQLRLQEETLSRLDKIEQYQMAMARPWYRRLFGG